LVTRHDAFCTVRAARLAAFRCGSGVIAAVNLPMLIKLASVRETSSLEQAVIQAQDAGRKYICKYICVASRVLDATPDRVDMPFDQVARKSL
jgi:mannose/fructose-specific phosphotransferase system component IIA